MFSLIEIAIVLASSFHCVQSCRCFFSDWTVAINAINVFLSVLCSSFSIFPTSGIQIDWNNIVFFGK